MILKENYIGLDLRINDSFNDFIKVCCADFDIVARNEFHITLFFLGNMKKVELIEIYKIIKEVNFDFDKSIEIKGIGGVYLNDDIINDVTVENHMYIKNYPKVIWLTVNFCKNYNLIISEVLAKNNIFFESEKLYSPHITIGSNHYLKDKVVWDVHNIIKGASIKNINKKLEIKKFHISNKKMQPDSIILIKNYSK